MLDSLKKREDFLTGKRGKAAVGMGNRKIPSKS
jgi:hypothetical protein